MHPSRHFFSSALLGAALACAATAASGQQQDYPVRPIKLIVPFSPGSGSDTIGRTLAEELARQMGVAVTVENREGGGGLIGHTAAAKAPADGYTLLLGASTMAMSVHMAKPQPYDASRDFTAVGRVAEIPMVAVVAGDGRNASWPDWVAAARSRPGGIHYATSGKGGAAHLFSEILKKESGFAAEDVPYKSIPQALMDVSRGNPDFYLANVPPIAGMLASGQLRMLAVGSAQRLREYPSVPTFAELLGKPDFRMALWYGVFVPAGTPPPAVARLSQEVGKAAASPAMRSRIDAAGGLPTPADGRVLDEQLRADNVLFAGMIKDLGLLPGN